MCNVCVSADAFTQQLIGSKEARPVQQQQHHNQEDPQPSHVQEEVEVELQDLDEAEIIKFTYNRRCVMGPPEDVELMAREETGSTDSNQDVLNVLSSETEDSEDYSKDEADPRPALNRWKPKLSRRRAGCLSCRVCSQTFRLRRLLFRHVKSHLLEAEHVCGLCGERSETTDSLSLHLKTHWATRNKNPENQTKTQKERRQLHQRSNANVHEEQKPNKCDTCGKKRKHRCCPQDKNQNPEGPEGTKRKRKRRKS